MSKSKGHGSFFWLEMREDFTQIGLKFAISLDMGKKLPQKLYVKTCRNAISGYISRKNTLHLFKAMIY